MINSPLQSTQLSPIDNFNTKKGLLSQISIQDGFGRQHIQNLVYFKNTIMQPCRIIKCILFSEALCSVPRVIISKQSPFHYLFQLITESEGEDYPFQAIKSLSMTLHFLIKTPVELNYLFRQERRGEERRPQIEFPCVLLNIYTNLTNICDLLHVTTMTTSNGIKFSGLRLICCTKQCDFFLLSVATSQKFQSSFQGKVVGIRHRRELIRYIQQI